MGELKIQYSDKKITPWGGMKLLKDFMDHLGVMSYLSELNLPQPASNRGYEPKIIIVKWYGVNVGKKWVVGRFFKSLLILL